MQKFGLFFLLLFFFSVNVFSVQKRTIKVIDIPAESVMENGVYVQSIELENAHSAPVVSLKNVVYETAVLPAGAAFSTDSTSISLHLGVERKKQIAAVSFPLYIKRNDVVEKIVAFDIVVEEEDVLPNAANRPFVAHSVLASGTWYKIAVNKKGIYKIDYNFLQSLGINPATVNPANIRIYGNGGTVINEAVNDGAIDDLHENAIQVVSNGSSFGQNDYVLFYANGPVKWEGDALAGKFNHTNNFYENSSFYFLNVDLGPGKRISNLSPIAAPGTLISEYDEYKVYDVDSINIGRSGKKWYSNEMNSLVPSTQVQQFTFDLSNSIGQVKYDLAIACKMDVNSGTMSLSANNVPLTSRVMSAYPLGVMFADSVESGAFTPNANIVNFKLSLNTANTGYGYLDYLRLNYKKQLTFVGSQMAFRSFKQLQTQGNITYTVSNANGNTKIWELDNNLEPKLVQGTLNGGIYSFNDVGGKLKEYICFDGSNYLTPTKIGTVENQDLHGLSQVDYVIITNKELLPAANELADFHRTKFGTSVHVVTVDKIYNEFSSGGQDIGGIRNFIRMFYDRGTANNLIKNVLLFGAASYDYKNRVTPNTNIVPAYQKENSDRKDASFATDDYYGLLDDGEDINRGDNAGAYIDIGVGRLPARNLNEAKDIVKKIKNYVSPASFGEWKNNVTFVTDDYESGFTFLQSSEGMSADMSMANKTINHSKLYTDAAPRISTTSGIKFPTITRDINNQINKGTMLMNYIGHGGPQRWAVEEILYRGDIEKWNNFNKLAILFSGTCDFGRFDDPLEFSSGSYMITKADGGAIAALTTTQEVYEDQTNKMNAAFIKAQFAKNSDGRYLTFGEAFRKAKNAVNLVTPWVQFNTQKVALLGDPGIKPGMPENIVVTDSILELKNNNQYVLTDSMKALGKYKIVGKVTNPSGVLKSDFNGQVMITIFDKKKTVTATNPALLASSQTKTYTLQNNILFKGTADVKNGVFNLNAIIAKDINYDFGNAKLSYYAYSATEDAAGADTNVIMGGFSPYAGTDNEGPIVKPYIDNNKFKDGGIVSPEPTLYVELSDNNGINVSGSSVGHDLIAVLDGNYDNPFILNAFYVTEPNDYTKGKVYFKLNKLPSGKHSITVRAWDVYNNSGQGTVNFEVVQNDTLSFELYNYPNPFRNATNIVFQHNQPNTDMDVTLRIFSSNGVEVYNKTQRLRPEGSHSTWIWNGVGNLGNPVSSGIYFYQMQIDTKKIKAKSAYQKMVLQSDK